jgi:aryl-alcohol dehydrogenase-like predicted oxidoreductase
MARSGVVPDPFERVALGRTAVRVTRLGLGCAPLGNMYTALGDEQACATVDAAWELGIRWFDTAPLYGHGLSEQRLGAALRSRSRADCVVATKVGRLLVPGHDPATIFAEVPPLRPQFDFSYDGALRSLEASLERMGIDRVDVLHVHDPDDHEVEAIEGAFRALRRLREERVIGAVGAGMNQSAMPTRFVERGLVDCVLLAGRYSILDQSGLADLLPAAMASGVAVIAAGVFNSGLLADPKPGATFDYLPASSERIERAQRLRDVCAAHGVSLRAAALQFPTRHPAVATVLSGARSPAEITENARLFDQTIPPELWAALRADGLICDEAVTQSPAGGAGS